jgi:ADP-heptose:LPS heptosyltransferase
LKQKKKIILSSKTINKILVIRFSSLGDILLTTPVVRALKNRYTNAQIDFVIKEQYKSTLQYNPHINKLIVYEKRDAKKINHDLQIVGYDLVIDLQNNFRSRALTKKLDTEVLRFIKPTFKKLLLVWFKVNLLIDIKSITQRYAEAVKVELDQSGLELVVPSKIKTRLEANKNYIGLCPGSKHFTKRWLPEYFAELGNELTRIGYTAVIFGGQSDEDVCAEISKQINGSINLQNSDDLLQTAAEMKMCKVVVTNDSGLMHTASAVGAQVIAIFGSTVREFGFSPYGIKNLILENNSLICRPCSHIGKSACPQKHFRCMKEIKPVYVLNYLQTFLANI